MRGANIRGIYLTKKQKTPKNILLIASNTNILPKTDFQIRLKEWYDVHKRDLPWRKTDDPYKIWLSEIILQQTRVEQGLPYYQKFVKNYPTVYRLAQAQEDQVMKDWEGLGYYSRARNLQYSARLISQELNGEFPASYKEIIELKGVGEYTAAAIASFAFGEAKAVVDGNVFRVLSRYLGIETPINSTKGKKQFLEAAEQLLDKEEPSWYNQAIMEFGALQCVPKNPQCPVCPMNDACSALANGKVDSLPVKIKKNYNRERFFYFFQIENEGKVLVEKRTDSDIWKNLFQFPMVEFESSQTESKAIQKADLGIKLTYESIVLTPHKLSHQTIYASVIKIPLAKGSRVGFGSNAKWVKKEELEELAFPKPLRQYLDRNQLTLPLAQKG